MWWNKEPSNKIQASICKEKMKSLHQHIEERLIINKDYKEPTQEDMTEISSMIAPIYDNYVWTDKTYNNTNTVKFTTDGTEPFNDIYKILRNIIKRFRSTSLAKCDMWYINESDFSIITIAHNVKQNITTILNIYIDTGEVNYGKTALTCIYGADGPHIKQDREKWNSSKHFKIPFAVMYEIQEKFNISHV